MPVELTDDQLESLRNLFKVFSNNFRITKIIDEDEPFSHKITGEHTVPKSFLELQPGNTLDFESEF